LRGHIFDHGLVFWSATHETSVVWEMRTTL
jgi:hypothetical protein